MRALVLAGGAGTRLRPLTHTSAKQLIPVANRPVLFSALDAVAAAGIREAAIVVGDTEDEIRAAVGDGSAFGLVVRYLRQEAPLGLAHAVLIARDALGDEPFLMYLGDNVVMGGVTAYVHEFATAFAAGTAAAEILLTKVPDPRQFGVAVLDRDGRVVALEEKPANPRGDYVLAGVFYLFGPAIHEAVRAISPSERHELEITDAIQWMIDHGHAVQSRVITGYWKDTGRVEDLLDANRSMLEVLARRIDGTVDASTSVSGAVVLEAGSIVARSTLIGPLIIGAGTRVSDCTLGPYVSLGPGCIVESVVMTDSIALERSAIRGGRLDASLLGKDVTVELPSGGSVHRLVLGDHSQVLSEHPVDRPGDQ